MCDFSEYGIPSEEWLQIEAELPPPAKEDPPLHELKTTTNTLREAIAQKEMESLATKLSLQDHSIVSRDGYHLEARSYRPLVLSRETKLPIFIHFHGGGFLFGTLCSEDAICSRIAINAQVMVFNVNYRHTPEYQYPVAWNDAEDALSWVYDHAPEIGGDRESLVVGGISAGAWLAAALTQTNLRAPPATRVPIRGQVLMIPCLVYRDCRASQLKQLKDPSLSSYVQNENAPILPLSRMNLYDSLLNIEHPDPEDRRLNPGNATPAEVKRLPPTMLGVAGSDPLRDDALLYGKLLAENGIPTVVNVFKGLPHGFRRFGDRLSAYRKWDEVMEEGIRMSLQQSPPDPRYQLRVY